MPLAQSYLMGINPFAGVLEQFDSGLQNRRYYDESQALRYQQQQKQEAQEALQRLDFNDKEGLRQFAARYPEYGKGVTAYLANLDDKQQRALASDISQQISLLGNNRSDLALQIAKQKAQAFENAGDKTTAAEYREFASMIEQDPQAAHRALLMNYAHMVGKDTAAGYKDFVTTNRPDVRQVDTGDKIGTYAVDPITGGQTYGDVKFTKGVTPDAQLKSDTDVSIADGNNATQRYVSDNTLEGTKYSSDNSRAASQYSADMGYQGTKYSSDNSRAASQYSADRGYQGTVYGQDAQTRRTQMQVNSQERMAQARLYFDKQQAEIKNRQAELKEAGGMMYVVYKDGSYKPALDSQGNHMVASSSGKYSPQAEQKRATTVLGLVGEARSLLQNPNATGSWVGAGWDKVAGAFGKSTEGAQISAQLKTISGQLTAQMPRMEGPQSDKDVQLYREMAGNIGDETLPVKTRLAALAQIEKLNQKYLSTGSSATPANQASNGKTVDKFFTGN